MKIFPYFSTLEQTFFTWDVLVLLVNIAEWYFLQENIYNHKSQFFLFFDEKLITYIFHILFCMPAKNGQILPKLAAIERTIIL